MSAETCSAYLTAGPYTVGRYRCSRPAKRDGLCGIHLAAIARRQKNDEKREVAAAKATAASQSVAERLARHGIHATWIDSDGRLHMPSAGYIADQLDAKYGGAA